MSHVLDRSAAPKTACVTLDLEDNWDFEAERLRYLVFDHLDEYIEMIRSLDLPVTVFVVGQVLEERPEVVRRLDAELDATFHLHSYSHDMSGETDIEVEIRDGVAAFESVLGRRPRGYRAPRFIVDEGDFRALEEAGFEFDSSVCPSYRPGMYNNLGAPTEPYFPAEAPDLLELPVSVHPLLRIPFSQSYLRLLGDPYLRLLSRSPLPEPLVINSHLHDFFHTDAHDHLGGFRRFLFTHHLDDSVRIFMEFVELVRERGVRFRTLDEVADEIRQRGTAVVPTS